MRDILNDLAYKLKDRDMNNLIHCKEFLKWWILKTYQLHISYYSYIIFIVMTKIGWCIAPYFEKDREKEKDRPHSGNQCQQDSMLQSPDLYVCPDAYMTGVFWKEKEKKKKEKKQSIYNYL